MTFKINLLFLFLTLSTSSFSQKQKFENDLDSLFLNNGEIKTGYVTFKKEFIKFCKKRKDCVDIKLNEVEGFVEGKKKWVKRNAARKNKKLIYKKDIILQFKNKSYAHAILEYSGNKYDFYLQTVPKLQGNKYRYEIYTLITYHNKKKVIAWYRGAGTYNSKVINNALKLFKNTKENCKILEDLSKGTNRELRARDINIYEIIDNCDLTIKS